MKTIDAVRLFTALSKIAEIEERQPSGLLPIAGVVRLGLRDLIRTVMPIARDFEAERGALVRKYGVEKSPDNWEVTASNLPKFEAELAPMRDRVCKVQIKPFAAKDLDCLPLKLICELTELGVIKA